MNGERWITVPEFARVAGISRRGALKAVVTTLAGSRWRDISIVTREVAGQGGNGGKRYEVALSSLSEDLQRAYVGDVGNDFQPAAVVGCGYRPASGQGEKIERRWRIVQEAIEQPRGSVERKAEILRASRKWNTPTRTIYRWIAELERSGGDINALAHKLPSDAGVRRVWVSRSFDAAFGAIGGNDAQLRALGDMVDGLIKGAWVTCAQRAGWKQVRREVITAFQRECRNAGVAIPAGTIAISQRRINKFEFYRIVDIRANDRKRYDDAKPRIRRDNTKLAPMAQIVMDVKPLDCIVTRPDGSTTWPKMIAFQDTGTHRVFRHFVLLDQGEGVRQEHVIVAFMRMVAHPEWGFPQQLYRDNGTEFAMFDAIRSALALINEPGARTVINAKPYLGASKPIESKFATLDRFVFSQMGGWAGGNRMNKKTQTVGKPPKPYGGSFADFVREADERIEVFEHEPIGSGPFKGISPAQSFAQHVADGWRPVRIDQYALDAAFSKRDTRRVDRGAVSIGGDLYRHPDLVEFNGQTVVIALPWRRGAFPLVSIPDRDWAALQSDMMFLPGAIEGAIESTRMQQRSAGRRGPCALQRGRSTSMPI